MYRRPLQSAVRHLLNASASSSVYGKGVEQHVYQVRALVACRITAGVLSQCRALHSASKLCAVKETTQAIEEEVGAFTRLIEAMGFTGPLKYNKWKIKIAALRMYTCCVERINYDDFFEKCSLPDTLNSWFLVAQLHVWMCLVRMRQEGRTGKYMCRYIVHSMWEDVEQRSKIMGGILSDDSVLAAALWRNLFNRQCEDPRQLELMVEYVRKQMQFIDALECEDLLLTGEVKWRPLVEENAQSILKVATPTYNDTGL
ncbi:Ubiquinol-cytochrome-c reductase complex assembly factor 1 [Triplophysa tibetana]|uniref:Ubiquinol-cytochrome-c reductase complex assembly factor 1 n=1 Tax=Triplophysa tibetana TaxID=1572043 RepID=A0A5A9NSR3_9TELE|nr:Ubiquinol-cytochrome-c reductase complex assembly factor 1 [Triplophysa tibetana]